MAIWDDHGMTKEEYEAFEREYSDYLTETGQDGPPSEADMAEQSVLMSQPSQADIEDMRKERISYCLQHLDTMPDKMGTGLQDFHAMRDYYDSAAFLAEHGDQSKSQASAVARFAQVADMMSYDFDPYDYCDNVDLEDYMTNGQVDDARVHADQAAILYHDLMTGNAGYIANWMDENIQELEAAQREHDHVETRAEYEDRVRRESELFANMSFDDVLQYRVDKDMVLTDADKQLINDKICDEYTAIEVGHAQDMDMCDADIDAADYYVDTYANDYDAQREVASFGGSVPAYITNNRCKYPVDEHGRALTVDEFVASVEDERAVHTENYEKYRTALFDRVYDFHKLTMTPDALPKSVTGGQSSVSVITPSTFGYLGDTFKEYHADKVRQEFVQSGLVSPATVDWKAVDDKMAETKSQIGIIPSDPFVFDDANMDYPVNVTPKSEQIGLPVVDFTKSMTMSDKSIEMQTEVQSAIDKQAAHADNYNQYKAQRDQQRDDAAKVSRNRSGVSGFEGNRAQGGRSNPDYDFDEYD